MGNPGKILCPTDFSESSNHAVACARQLALLFKAELILVHVVPDGQTLPATETWSQVDPALQRRSARQAAEARIAETVALLVGAVVVCRSMILFGTVCEDLVRAAKDAGAGLIVMSASQSCDSGFSRYGSVLRYLCKHAPCPVLALRGPYDRPTTFLGLRQMSGLPAG